MLKIKLQSFGHLMRRTDSFEKTLMLGRIEGRRRRGGEEDKMVGWHHRLNGHEFEHSLGVCDGQRSLTCFGLWSYKESDTTEGLNWLIQMGISSVFSFAFCFSSFLSYLYGLLRQPSYLFAFLFIGDGFDHCFHTVLQTSFHSSSGTLFTLESICHFHRIIVRDLI